MNSLFKYCIVIVSVALSACATNPTFPLLKPQDNHQSEVLIYRESAFIAGGVSLTIGANNQAFATLNNNEYVRAFFPPGELQLYVQARSANPTRLLASLKPGERTCFRTSSNSNTMVKVLIPVFLMASGYEFYFDQVACPSSEVLAKYTLIPVKYKAQ